MSKFLYFLCILQCFNPLILIFGSEKHVLKETLCSLQVLPLGSYQVVDNSTVFWIPVNKSFHIVDVSNNGSLIVCQPFNVQIEDDCYSLRLDPGLYKPMENNSIAVLFPESHWIFSSEEYVFNNHTAQVEIPCLYGHFFSCLSNNNKQLSFGLSGHSLPHFDSTMDTFLFLGRKYGNAFSKPLMDHIHWPTICFERNLFFTKCNQRRIYNSSGYFKINDTQVHVNSSGHNYSYPEYKDYLDGTLEVCVNEEVDLHSDIISYLVTLILYSVSIICLLIHIIAFFLIPDMRELHGKIVLSFAICLLLHDSLLIVRIFIKGIANVCKIVGILIHFFRMGYYSWNSVIALNLYFKFKRFNVAPLGKNIQLRHYLGYSALVWTFIIFIIAASVVSDEMLNNSEFQARYSYDCDTSNRAVDVFFLAPAGVILLVNIILYILTWRSLKIISLSMNLIRCKRSGRKIISCYLRLTLILILTWIFIFVFKFTKHLVIRMIFNILIAFQGFYIFFSVSSPLIIKQYKHRKTFQVASGNQSSSDRTLTSVASNNSFQIPPIIVSKPSTDSLSSISESVNLEHSKVIKDLEGKITPRNSLESIVEG